MKQRSYRPNLETLAPSNPKIFFLRTKTKHFEGPYSMETNRDKALEPHRRADAYLDSGSKSREVPPRWRTCETSPAVNGTRLLESNKQSQLSRCRCQSHLRLLGTLLNNFQMDGEAAPSSFGKENTQIRVARRWQERLVPFLQSSIVSAPLAQRGTRQPQEKIDIDLHIYRDISIAVVLSDLRRVLS